MLYYYYSWAMFFFSFLLRAFLLYPVTPRAVVIYSYQYITIDFSLQNRNKTGTTSSLIDRKNLADRENPQ